MSTTGYTNNLSSESVDFQSVCPYVEATIQHPKWVKYGSLHVKKHVYLYLGSGSLYPIFGKVVDILVAGGHICVEENVTLYVLTLIIMHLLLNCDMLLLSILYRVYLFILYFSRKSFCKSNSNIYLNLKHYINL